MSNCCVLVNPDKKEFLAVAKPGETNWVILAALLASPEDQSRFAYELERIEGWAGLSGRWFGDRVEVRDEYYGGVDEDWVDIDTREEG